jgi:uncharacterized protein YciI
MSTFFCKLVPPRPTFAQDITPTERELMQEHGRYWHGCMQQGKVIAFGMVADPAAGFGMGIVEVADEAEARALTDADPVVRAGRGFRYEIYVMPRGAVHPPFAAS